MNVLLRTSGDRLSLNLDYLATVTLAEKQFFIFATKTYDDAVLASSLKFFYLTMLLVSEEQEQTGWRLSITNVTPTVI